MHVLSNARSTRFRLPRLAYCAAVTIVALTALTGCERKPEGAGEEGKQGESEAENPAPEVPFQLSRGQAGTLYTWVDGEGRFHLAEQIEEIPESARKQVRVVVDGHPPGTASHVFVADLSAVAPGESVPVRALARDRWEAQGLAYRQKVVQPLEEAARDAAQKSSQLPEGVDAVVYGAEWCNPCHQAEAYLKKQGLDVVKKDIEEDPSARQEMLAKLKKAGLGGSSIPIIDVGGTMLVGFSPNAIDAALRRLPDGDAAAGED